MTNFKRLCVIIAVCALIIPAAAKDKKPVESRALAAPIQIDGTATEWPADSLTLEKDVAVSYAFQNDANNLYALFQFNDPKYMSSVEATGLTLWINNDGKEKKTHGIHFYRKFVPTAELIKILESEGQALTDDKKKEFMSRPQWPIWACDVVNKKGEAVPRPGGSGGTFRMTKASKSMVYELILSMALLNDPGASTKWDPSKLLKIGFEWGGLTEDMKKAQAGNLGDQGSRASSGATDLGSQVSGGEGADFSAPGASLSGMRAISSKYKKYDFWLDLKIFPAK
jgi:hypothetical protein